MVLSSWQNDESGMHDVYVAFFGKSFPLPFNKPSKIPYILRYAESSLRLAGVGEQQPL